MPKKSVGMCTQVYVIDFSHEKTNKETEIYMAH